jgi:large subunit ribosomal protein L25
MALLRISKREKLGSRSSNRLRYEGRVPGIIYGHGEGNVSITLDKHELETALHHGERLLKAELDGEEKNLLLKDVQYDYLGKEVIHVDLMPVSLSDRVEVTVTVTLRGVPVGVSAESGVLSQAMQQIHVECLVTAIPDEIRVAVGHLKVGETLRVKDLQLPEGITVKEDPEHVVASVTMVAEEVEAVVAEPTVAEPEVIGAKPAEGEEAEGEEAKTEKPEKKAEKK